MHIIKRLAIGAASSAILLSSAITPAFAAANAWNKNIDGGSFAKSKAEDNDTYTVKVKNKNTHVYNATVAVSSSGSNHQSHNQDGNKLKTGDNWSLAKTENNVNTTVISL